MSTDRRLAVAEAHQPVVEVVLVRLGRVAPAAGPAHDGEGGVEHRDAEDEERDEDRGEEEVGAAAEGLVGLADDRHGRRRHSSPRSMAPASPMKIGPGGSCGAGSRGTARGR